MPGREYWIKKYTMEFNIIEVNNIPIAEVKTSGVLINNVQDAVDLIGNCRYQGADRIIIKAEQIIPDFFDLKTRIAGEILQKFSNYQVQVAIIGDYRGFTSKSLKDFIIESNKGSLVSFVASIDEAKGRLSK
jgi:hypothetical protein